jgi:hypothetical protein
MTLQEIRKNVLRTQAEARELYGYHEFLRRWWVRDGFGFASSRLLDWPCLATSVPSDSAPRRW